MLLAARAVFSDLRASAETAPRIDGGAVESRRRATFAGAFYGVGWLTGVRWVERGLHSVSPELTRAIQPTVTTCLVVGAGCGLASAIWLIRWERRSGLLLARGSAPPDRPARRPRRVLGLFGPRDVVALPSARVADPGGVRTPREA